MLPILLAAAAALAADEAPPPHGPKSRALPSHSFQLAARSYAPQLNVHFGLSQPLLLDGFNIASDLRVRRWVFEYSHGMRLDYNALAGEGQTSVFVPHAGADVDSPWTTGFGIGHNVLDDLYVMAEFKAHRYEIAHDGDRGGYTTASVGPALGYRLFLWRGLNLTAYARFWPNVWTSTGGEAVTVGGKAFDPINLRFFGNLSLGWAFDLTP